MRSGPVRRAGGSRRRAGGFALAITLTFAAGTTGCGSATGGGGEQGGDGASGADGGAAAGSAQVVRVIDGDTIEVRVGGAEERVRLLGINTPESVDPDRPVMCYGPEASAHLKELLPDRSKVRLELDQEPRDKFGRLLAYVFLPTEQDEVFVNLRMLEEGYANHFIKEPNDAYARRFRAASGKAREARRGLWGACPKPFEE